MSHVLVTGGDASLYRVLCAALTDRKWTIAPAPCGPNARGQWPGPAAHLLLIVCRGEREDVQGWIAAAHRQSPALPVVVLIDGRGDDTLPLRRRAFALGAADVIGWPADLRALHARLAAVCLLADHGMCAAGAAPGVAPVAIRVSAL